MAVPQLVHGTILAGIMETDNIHDSSRLSGKLPSFLGHLAQGLEEMTGVGKGHTRVYVTVNLDSTRIARTRTIPAPDRGNPRWDEVLRAYCAHDAAEVVFSVMVEELYTAPDNLFGRAYLPVGQLLAAKRGENITHVLYILDAHRKQLPGAPKLYMAINFNDVDSEGASVTGVPHYFFPQRQACRVTMYQDAHVDDDGNTFAPTIPLAGGKLYKPAKCWEEMYDAISKARHLVYVTGWSVSTEITLVRAGGANQTLGELLKRKAGEGVRVLLLVWNDFASVKFLHTLGNRFSAMYTNDEETAKYFSQSDVHCVLSYRNISTIAEIGQTDRPNEGAAPWWAHHQKSIIVDQELLPSSASGGRRQIVSFLGGLDICDGRYDTQSHSLFRTLGTGQAHHKDFHQPSFSDASVDKGGPRDPWHDIHSKIEGPAAWDVLDNFQQRWRKQGGINDLLLDLVSLESTAVVPSSWPVIRPDDQEAWNVQVLRSIDNNSVLGFPATMEDTVEAGLVHDKHQKIERSIQDAYIQAIRAAKNFIYIENQYFIGSSFHWKAEDGLNLAEVEAMNLIPRELSLKIVKKIKARQRFTVYVVLPMWPDCDPSGQPAGQILFWQRKTMEMMYDDIGAALQEMKMQDATPRDYLTFFWLGNREVKKEDEYQPAGRPQDGTHYAKAQKARRFMIYVHAKMMIVDDEHIIVGSANLNQRSLDGARDSEIAIRANQPHPLNATKGQVHGLRMSLWSEHLGSSVKLDDFQHPESLACVRKVNQTAEHYWRLYTNEHFTEDLPGHLLAYPIDVNKSGTVSALKGFECFPDTNAPVRGTHNTTDIRYMPLMTT